MKKIIIVGRTNIGKSTLFNKLCNEHLSMIYDAPDTTRDYISYHMENITITDTMGVYTPEDFQEVGIDILAADIILFMVAGEITDQDLLLNKFLAKQNIALWLVVNQIDRYKNDADYYKKLRFNKIFFTSTTEHKGLFELREALELNNPIMHDNIAIVGRCNSGKSTLLNALAGYERSSTSHIQGTTIDNLRIAYTTRHNRFYFVDTPGYGRNESYYGATKTVDHIAAKRREYALKTTTGVVLVCDGQLGFTKLDKEIFWELFEKMSFIIIAINKEDLMDQDSYNSFAHANLPPFIPMINICALNGRFGNLLHLIDRCYGDSRKEFSTSELNKWLQTSELQLRSDKNKLLKLKYIRQEQREPWRHVVEQPTQERKGQWEPESGHMNETYAQKPHSTKSHNQMRILYDSLEPLHKNSEKLFTRKFTEYFGLLGVPLRLIHITRKKNPFVKH